MAITGRQRELLDQWFPGAAVARDHSWGLVGTTVLELTHEGARYIVKAADDKDHHLAREVHAHREWLAPWASLGRAPQLVHADEDAKLLVTRYLPGTLVEGSADESRQEVYFQAGELLARLHAQFAVEDAHFEAKANAKSLWWLNRPNRIAVEDAARLRAMIEAWPVPASVLVPTHGDWQPRNWLVHEGQVRVIDFGRSELRPAFTDFARLSVQQFRADPLLERSFLAGYGEDPRESRAWQRNLVREAIGTVSWAYQVGDTAFEEQGRRMIADVLVA
ncbi:aminoglycoside phosphotransferase family protein [Amycolatopsis acidicola]|uniref:Aminoglycoside phosphotransferase family protein n=1 Tax=Amycolatopsis acidicola TaxID=2596893 RepID=A0A5N0V3G5_9PSEU|nr:aminoglycoside phosphotransferase family protein [Amycolatopsis acidicola]KAA9159341.1 aminoglycoside phosphotransferase family protein [Amycolatopsis acidicola]